MNHGDRPIGIDNVKDGLIDRLMMFDMREMVFD
jgi:hypothetical protein